MKDNKPIVKYFETESPDPAQELTNGVYIYDSLNEAKKEYAKMFSPKERKHLIYYKITIERVQEQ